MGLDVGLGAGRACGDQPAQKERFSMHTCAHVHRNLSFFDSSGLAVLVRAVPAQQAAGALAFFGGRSPEDDGRKQA
jgi:hypothetical protein